MKKALAVILMILLVGWSSTCLASNEAFNKAFNKAFNITPETVHTLAEIDLSGMSFDDLVSLKDQINKAIWECDEWQEVTVPQGVYQVGVDIPAGYWTIAPAEGQWGSVKWGDVLDSSGLDINYWDKKNDVYVYEVLCSESNRAYDPGDRTRIDLDVKVGQYIIVGDGDMVFSPYSGKPDLGFKK